MARGQPDGGAGCLQREQTCDDACCDCCCSSERPAAEKMGSAPMVGSNPDMLWPVPVRGSSPALAPPLLPPVM